MKRRSRLIWILNATAGRQSYETPSRRNHWLINKGVKKPKYAQTAIAGYTHNGGLIYTRAYVDEKR